MRGQGLVLCAVFVPLLGAFLLPFIGKRSVKLRNLLALAFVAIAFIASVAMLPGAMANAPVSVKVSLPLGFSFGFLADSLAVFMAMASSLLGTIIVFYSIGYIAHYENQNEYYMIVVMFLGAMMGLVYSTNLLFIYLFWEISAIACWRLIGFFREKYIIRRADKAFLITVGGALVMLIGFIMIYNQTGTFDLTEMDSPVISNIAMLFILFGILSKSATLPFHSWLADAGVAPSPVTSLLGVYVFARIFLVTISYDPIWYTIIPIIAAVSALVSAGVALVETDLKRIIAYSTVSQLGFILLGLSCGTEVGIAGALLYILMHGLAKGGLFLCAGVVEHATHTKDVRKLGGLAKNMPLTAMAFLLCSFSVMGIPPFGGFFSKHMVISGAVMADQPWIAFTFILGAVLTVIYLLRAFVLVFMGECNYPDAKEGTWHMTSSVVALAFISLLAGIFINVPSGIVQSIMHMMGW